MKSTIRLCILIMLLGIQIPSATQAQTATEILNKSRDVLRQLQTAAQQNKQSPASQQDGAANTSNIESDSASKLAEAHSSGSGPDVLGLRIGMAPSDARAIIKSRPRWAHYFEQPATLAFSLPGPSGSVTQRITGADFIGGIKADGRNPDGGSNAFTLRFSAIPGREELVYIYRQAQISPDKKPTYEAFLKTLTDKYGAPTYLDPINPSFITWSFNNKGTPYKSRDFSHFAKACLGFASNNGLGWSAGEDKESVNLPRLIRDCGATVIQVYFGFDGVIFAGPQTLVNNYTTTMVGLEATAHGQKIAQGIIDEARQKASSKAINAGQQQKPEL